MNTTSLYKDLVFDETRPLVTVLVETDFSKELRITLNKGTKMKEHQTPYPIVVALVEGKVEFGVSGKRTMLEKGDLIALEGDVPHDIEAQERSIIRLTISKHDRVERVQKVATS